MEKKAFIVDGDIQLVKFLQSKGCDFVAVKRLLRQKDVKVNSIRTNKDILLKRADKVEVYLRPRSHDNSLAIDKIYEDDYVLVVNKRPHIETCGIGGIEGRLGVIAVHRLDRNTSGLMVFAKTERARAALDRAFKQRSIVKKYLCLVHGDTHFNGETFRAYLVKDSKKSRVYVFDSPRAGSKEILTQFRTMRHGVFDSVVECNLLTGRTHQIRAHLAFLSHFIIGDNKYGDKEINRGYGQNVQLLSCTELAFPIFEEESLKGISGKTFNITPTWLR